MINKNLLSLIFVAPFFIILFFIFLETLLDMIEQEKNIRMKILNITFLLAVIGVLIIAPLIVIL